MPRTFSKQFEKSSSPCTNRRSDERTDSLSMAKTNGGHEDEIRIAIHWALAICGTAGFQRLIEPRLVELGLAYPSENNLGDRVR